MAKIDAFFNLMFEQKASDLHLSSGNPPMLRINGETAARGLSAAGKRCAQDDALRNRAGLQNQTVRGNGRRGFRLRNSEHLPFPRQFFQRRKTASRAVFRQIPSRVLSFEDFEKFDVAAAAGAEKICHAAPRSGRRDRPDRFRQIHDAGGDGGLREQKPQRPHHHR